MTKRSEISTDDLMRQQEGPAKKRPRLEESVQRKYILNDDSDDGSYDDTSKEDEKNASEGSEPSSSPRTETPSLPPLQERFNFTKNAAKKQQQQPERPQTDTNAQTTFASLGISKALQASLSIMSIRSPTEVQAACIPPLLSGKDCIGNAKTGSGKTIAFALPILQKLSVDPYGIFALVLTPTRELAFQISEQFAVLGSSLNIKTAVIVGGMDMMAQALELGNRPHVVVATPGRIVDHLRSGSGEWDLSRVKFLVLDEADRLLTPTFAPELTHLFRALPKERQTCLFTATLTPSIEAIAADPPKPGKEPPVIYRMNASAETVETLTQHYILVPSHIRESYLFHLLCNPPESITHLRRAPEPTTKKSRSKSKKNTKKKASVYTEDEAPEQPPPTIIFCTRPRTAAYLTNLLKTLNIRSTALHSRLTQRERLSSLGLFRSSVVPVLISTDVGARGLDIEDVAMVINWDIPNEPEEYTHRVGRTARAGRGGVAVSFVTEKDEERILKIEERIKVKLVEMSLSEEKVLEKLSAVSTAKRLANMELHDSDFGKREEIHRIKGAQRRAEIE